MGSAAAAGSSTAASSAIRLLVAHSPHRDALSSISQPCTGISFNPLQPKALLSASCDGTCRLYSSISHAARVTLSPSPAPPTCIQWSPSRATVFAAGASDGRVCVLRVRAAIVELVCGVIFCVL